MTKLELRRPVPLRHHRFPVCAGQSAIRLMIERQSDNADFNIAYAVDMPMQFVAAVYRPHAGWRSR